MREESTYKENRIIQTWSDEGKHEARDENILTSEELYVKQFFLLFFNYKLLDSQCLDILITIDHPYMVQK